MKRILIGLAGVAVLCAACSEPASEASPPAETAEATPLTESETPEMSSIYDVEFAAIDGTPLPFSTFENEVVLVVNTASKCGYTPQYEGLQALQDEFSSQGFTVLGVPSNDFGGQEPGTEEEVKTFCEINYGVDFPLTSKVHAIGPEQHAFWQAAKAAIGDQAEPQWNFHKVLVSKDGKVLKAYPSATKPADAELVADIEAAISS